MTRSRAPHGFCTRCAAALVPRVQEDRERPTCPSCGFISYLDPKVAVAVVLGGPRGILLGRRNVDPARGAWSFPAGYVNRGEELELAALREVREEIGVDARLTGLVGAYSRADDPVVLVVYAGELVAGEPRPDGREIQDVRLFPLESLPAFAFHHDSRILEDWKRLVGIEASPGHVTGGALHGYAQGDDSG